MNEKRLLWLDLETTGLDPEEDDVLELGMILTDGDLRELAHFSETVRDSSENKSTEDQIRDPKVLDMHRASGLLADCWTSTWPWREVSLHAEQWVAEHAGPEPLPLCGSTIGFDRSFLRVHAPRLHARFHYRSVDVSTLKNLWDAWGLPPWPKPEKKAHRSLADLRDSVAELRHYMTFIRHSDWAAP